ncbi:MAG: hypothetical protein MI919_17095 [Holophagales bacterium]|nr:hypothetical protein [Holophagales bacterium]
MRPRTRRSPLRPTLLALLLLSIPAAATEVPPGAHEVELSYYLPADVEYDPSIPPPSQVLGFEVGEWHVRHDLLVRYMEAVAEASDRVQLEVTGRTHEARPLLLLTVSSPANLERLGTLREQHLALSEGNGAAAEDVEGMPVVVNMGYSVHGNEPSGANASLLLAYHLAAAQDPFTTEVLENAVILLDPTLNPDGLSRFAQWANMHRGRVPVADPNHREHREAWPSGRTNHYWFDLNRDWLLGQHPESQARLGRFHHWRPNVLTDFHEMGTGATYFFQPGVPSRKNPLTPERNVELTQAFAEEHARALDRIGALYYAEETFDDFYYGKGSTYPDIHGAVGILFEQASSRGHAQESRHVSGGNLTFPYTIRNQFTTSLSTLRAALDKRVELLEYQRDFYAEALAEGQADSRRAFVFGDGADRERTLHLVELLRRHGIEVRRLADAVSVEGTRFEPGTAFLVPLAQRQYRLVRSLFETVKEFEDRTFYDVSTWTLPLAFGLPSAPLGAAGEGTLSGALVDDVEWPAGAFPSTDSAAAYAFDWSSYHAPRALRRLLDAELKVRVAKEPFTARTSAGERAFARGTILIPTGIQDAGTPDVAQLLATVAREEGVDVHALVSGLTPEGIDLGSPNAHPLERPRVAVLVDGYTRAYDAGEAWHLLDHRFGVETTLLETDHLSAESLDRYSHLVLVNGATSLWNDDTAETVRSWVRRGGVVLAQGRSAAWAGEHLVGTEKDDGKKDDGKKDNGEKEDGDDRDERRPYASFPEDAALQLLSGTIFEVELDLTHPLAFGYTRERLPVFRTDRSVLEAGDDPYSKVAMYSQEPWLSGYVSPENVERLRGTPAMVADRLGRGSVIRLADNPNFRAFWYGTSKLFLNSIFFGQILDRTSRQEPR